jgi:CRISPR/Cas system CMR subunit Cmr4 (Cas7 group RAMP superfamily)
MKSSNDHIYLARIVVEANTPLRIGTGTTGAMSDDIVARDVNGLPFLPATSLVGVLRHTYEDAFKDTDKTNHLFGFRGEGATEDEPSSGAGSLVVVTNGCLLKESGDKCHEVIENIASMTEKSAYYQAILDMPTREHVRISHRGAAEDGGKFDKEVVVKGTRFVFEIELSGTKEEIKEWSSLLNIIHQEYFRIGGGTRNGFGDLNIITCNHRIYNLRTPEDLDAYLNKQNSLNAPFGGATPFLGKEDIPGNFIEYRVKLKPEYFFLFGAGFAGELANHHGKTEKSLDWSSGKPQVVKKSILVPATSIKGAIAHRVAFHYNDLTGTTIESSSANAVPGLGIDGNAIVDNFDFQQVIDAEGMPIKSHDTIGWDKLKRAVEKISLEDMEEWEEVKNQVDDQRSAAEKGSTLADIGINNAAVRELFGYAKEDCEGQRGRVISSDVFIPIGKTSSKVLPHLKVDRFTGGAYGGALYYEEVTTTKEDFDLKFQVDSQAFQREFVREAFEETLNDLCEGRLPLGGNVNKGHGAFLGSWSSSASKEPIQL